MSENNVNYSKIPAEFMNSLRRQYKGKKAEAVEDCPSSEAAIAYAFEELEPAERHTIEDHLQICRSCMNLVLDARTADIESQEAVGRPVKILPELSDAITRPERASFIEKLAAAIRMPSMVPKIIATVAVACMVIPATYYVLKDPATNKKLPIVAKKVKSVQNKKSRPAEPPANDLPAEPSSLNSITIHDSQTTDPFEPVHGDTPRPSTALKKRARSVPHTPLEKLDLSQLKLVGVMLSDKENKALVEDASGKGYVLKEGTYIGTNAGKVTQILKDRFIVEEEIEDINGKRVLRIREIKLHKP